MSGSVDSRELSSWKEIASYLGVGVRTAQDWERLRGLPVRRLPGPRGVVSASSAELDVWRAGGVLLMETSPVVPLVYSSTRRWWSRVLMVVLVPVLVGLAAFSVFVPSFPVVGRVDDLGLVVLDARGHEVWRQNFVGGLTPMAWTPSERRLWVGDLDGDGRPEVLFAARAVNPVGDDFLICYAADGRERWRYHPGRSVRTSLASYSSVFSVRALAVTRLRDRMVIALSSSQHPDDPAQVSLLGGDGTLLGEYWHLGHLSQVDFVEHMGHPLLYLGGISNLDHAATLVVLDPLLLHDVRQSSNGPFLGVERFNENARILFPRSTMNQRFESYNGTIMMEKTPDGVDVHVQERFGNGIGLTTLIYHLTPKLQLRDIGATDLFRLDHEHLLPFAGSVQEEVSRLANAYPLR